MMIIDFINKKGMGLFPMAVVIIFVCAAIVDTTVYQAENSFIFRHLQLIFAVITFLIMSGFCCVFYRKIKFLERTLIQSKNEMSAILDNIPDMVWMKDKNARYLFVNRHFSKYLGLQSEDIIGKNVFDIWDKKTATGFFEDDQCVFSKGKSLKKERSITHDNGNREWVEIFNKPLFNDVGKVVGTVGVARNITEKKYAEDERKELEIQLRQSQKMEAIGTLAGGIAHDFNNILAAVMGYTEIAIEELPESHHLKEKLERVLSAGARGKALVNQILTFSRQKEKEQQQVNLSILVEEALKMLRPLIPSTINIQSHLQSSSNMIIADPTQIHQVIINLCTNSSHAMRQNGGNLDISVEDVYLDHKSAAQYVDLKPGPHVVMTVTDTGHGMDKSIVGRIFEPFFTTKKMGDGTGMGLSVVHGIVKGLKGTIMIESEPGKGSAFKVFFPSINGNTKPVEKYAEGLYSGDERIMIVDDESAIVEVTKEMLESLGYRVDAFSDSLEALSCFKKNTGGIDLVITDQTMPSMTGEQLSKMIKQIRPSIPIVMLTGYSEEMTEEKALEMGIEAYIMKPFAKKDLALSVRQFLDKGKTIQYPQSLS